MIDRNFDAVASTDDRTFLKSTHATSFLLQIIPKTAAPTSRLNTTICLDSRYIEIYVEKMKDRHRGRPDSPHSADGSGGHHHGRHHRPEGGRHGRPFDYGELRLLVLAMIAEQPRHGYELIKAIEERMGGTYTPSPGVIYPTLSWLEDMGYAQVQVEGAGRKRYSITPEGEASMTANKAAIDGLYSRVGTFGGGGRNGPRDGVPAPILRGMENLKLALRLRRQRGPLDQAAADVIAAALDAAAQAVERS